MLYSFRIYSSALQKCISCRKFRSFMQRDDLGYRKCIFRWIDSFGIFVLKTATWSRLLRNKIFMYCFLQKYTGREEISKKKKLKISKKCPCFHKICMIALLSYTYMCNAIYFESASVFEIAKQMRCFESDFI